MAKPITLEIRPRQGRGLSPIIGGPDSGELWDAFLDFQNVIVRDGAWIARPGDISNSLNAPFTGRIRSGHVFNQDIAGVLTTVAVYVADDKLYKENGTLIEALSSPYDLYYNNVKNRLFYGGRNNEPRVWNGTLLAQWGAEGPIGVMTYVPFTANDADAGIQIQTVSVTNLSPTVTRVSGSSFVTGTSWVGKTIVIDGVPYPIQSVGGVNTLTLAVNYDGATASPVSAQVHYGSRTWTIAPKYAYAYYNPTTGHCTNASPVLTLAETEMENVNCVIGAIATNPTLNGYGYTKIVIFRNGQSSSEMLPLRVPTAHVGSDGNGFFNNTGGPHSLLDNMDDTQLGAVLGRKIMPTENYPCPQHTYQAYHRGRFWVVSQDEPWKIRYSADATLSLGVPEESWPENNFITVPNDDGYATGLKVVGGDLLVPTTRWAQFLTGDSPGNFDLRRLATRGFGIQQRAIAEHPGDSSIESASAIYVSRDRRLWRHFAGGRIEDIGAPIQNYLDAVRSLTDQPSPFLVDVFMLDKNWILALGISSAAVPAGEEPRYEYLFYDFDLGLWMDWFFLSIYGMERLATTLVNYIIMSPGSPFDGKAAAALLRNPGAGIFSLLMLNPTFNGGYMKFRFIDHGDWKVKKELQCIRLYTDDGSAPWAVSAHRDRGTIGEQTMVRRDTTIGSPRDKGLEIVEFVTNGTFTYHAIAPVIVIPNGRRLFRIDLECTPESTMSSGTPA